MMKSILSSFMMTLILVGLSSCGSGNSKTIANLKAAIDGEATAAAKYAAFSEQAVRDSLFSAITLFQATSQAEHIHLRHHQAVLEALGVTDYQPNIGDFEVKSTDENLRASIDGESYEAEKMYPDFLRDAEQENVAEALTSFKEAQAAEKNHAKLYADMLSKVATPSQMDTVFYLCPKCGNVYAGTPDERCEICDLTSDKFITFKANIPVQLIDGTTGASGQMHEF